MPSSTQLSPSLPIDTRAAVTPTGFSEPCEQGLFIDGQVGALCVFLASDAACAMRGGTLYVDAGFHIL